ncbi:MAG: D-alanyl-D-alanine carboxypeptidase/D-alanyl-D-alanine-endopeptidase [Planctomycetota bacterium]
MRHATAILVLLLGLSGCSYFWGGPSSLAEPSVRSLALAEELDEILTRHDTNAIVAARVVRVGDGAELYARNADVPMIPASNMKLLVSAAALDHFGADHTFDTHLYRSGDDLILVGTGDPALGDPTIARWNGVDHLHAVHDFVDSVKEAGMTEVATLFYDDTALPEPRVAASWDTEDLVYWYAAPVSGLNFNDNCIDVTARPADTNDTPAVLDVVPPTTDAVHIVNLTTTTNTSGVGVSIEKTQNASVYAVVGDVHEARDFKSRPVSDPGYFTADVLRTMFEDAGVTVGEVRSLDREGSGVILATASSAMPDVLRRVNNNSQNLFAEALSKLLGDATGHGPTWEGSHAAIVAFLEDAGIDSTGFAAIDGSGLSRNNRVTVRQLSELMRHMVDHPDADTFSDSLSIGGGRGTLARRFSETDDTIRGKTGFIGGVRALTVYADADNGESYIVSILYNQISGSVRPFEKLQDEAVLTVLEKMP